MLHVLAGLALSFLLTVATLDGIVVLLVVLHCDWMTENKYGSSQRSGFGHPTRLTINGQDVNRNV